MGTHIYTAVEITHPLQYSFQKTKSKKQQQPKKPTVLNLSPNQHQAESQGLS